MYKHKLPSQAELKDLFDYDPETGIFIWRRSVGRKIRAGVVAGTPNNGYIRIRIGGVAYKAHRLAWVYVFGFEPAEQIDHINRDGLDNRIVNLREATHLENSQNRVQQTNKSGCMGVHWCQSKKKWVAQIMTGRTKRIIGVYEHKNEAAAAYAMEKKRLHPFQTAFQ